MASQRLFIAKLAGDAATVAADRFRSWHDAMPAVDAATVDGFCASLRDNATSLPVVYFSEWVDLWLSERQILGRKSVDGQRFSAACFTRKEAVRWAKRLGVNQYQEEEWLAARLREAASAWKQIVDPALVVVVREALGALVTDEEIEASLKVVPDWLAKQR